jgi:hypothetical protein
VVFRLAGDGAGLAIDTLAKNTLTVTSASIGIVSIADLILLEYSRA